MKIITQHADLLYSNGLPEKVDYKIQVERAARTCYRSHDKITDGSADALLDRLVKHKHYAMMEFGTVAMNVRSTELARILTETIGTGYYQGVRKTSHMPIMERNREILSGNMRGIIQVLIGAYEDSCVSHNDRIMVTAALQELCAISGAEKLIHALRPQHSDEYLDWQHDIGKFRAFDFLDMHVERANMTKKERLAHTYATIRFITDRGVTHEMVRHRVCSFAQASTRYISYSDGKMEIILPVWCSENLVYTGDEDADISGDIMEFSKKFGVPIEDIIWLASCSTTEDNYTMLMDGYKWSAQRARTVLNNSLATEIVVQANLEQWNHMFNQRSIGTTGAPHPQMQDLMRRAHMTLRFHFDEDIVDVPDDGLVMQRNDEQVYM